MQKKKGTRSSKWVWKMKHGVTWKAIKRAVLSTMKHYHLHLTCASKMNQQLSLTPLNKKEQVAPPAMPLQLQLPTTNTNKTSSSCRLPKSLASLLQMPLRSSDFIDFGDHMTPTKSPTDNISSMWREFHGLHNWENLIDPLHPSLRREIVKYGELAQATYDAFDFDPLSEFCGSCRYNKNRLFEELGLAMNGYKVTKYIYALSHVDVPAWFERSQIGETWSEDSNWMGYVAVSNDEESVRIGRRDIVMAWRGTVAPSEWFTDLKTKLEYVGDGNVRVQHGFLKIYKSKHQSTRYNKSSASEQVIREFNRLLEIYNQNGEKISFTITGHSLGGALALLNAYEAAKANPNLPISVVSFGAPRVGNLAFKEKLTELGVKTLRVVIEQDIVPKVPGMIISKIFRKLNVMTQKMNWVYRHVGTQLKLDIFKSPYLKQEYDWSGSHNLEIYLHLLDGYLSKRSKFRWNARRDVALVNKSTDMLVEELKIPEFWFQLPHKGLVLNKHGRWVKPGRNPEDVPCPFSD